MPILQVSNNMIHMAGAATKNTTTGRFNSKVDFGYNLLDDSEFSFISFNNAPVGDTVWYEFDMYVDYITNGQEDGSMFSIYDGSGRILCDTYMNNGSPIVRVYGTSTVTAATGVFISAGMTKVKVAMTVNGSTVSAKWYFNGTLIATATSGNSGGKTVARSFKFNLFDAVSIAMAADTFSSFIASESDRSNNGYTKLVPSSFGTDTGFTGGTVDNLKDDDIATGLAASTSGDKSSFNMATYSGGSAINSYVATAVVSVGSGGDGNFRFYLLIGGTRYYGASQSLPANATAIVLQQWDNDPSDSGAWTQSKINAAQVGIEALS